MPYYKSITIKRYYIMSWFQHRMTNIGHSYNYYNQIVDTHQNTVASIDSEIQRLENERGAQPQNIKHYWTQAINRMQQDRSRAFDRVRDALADRNAISNEAARHAVGWLFEINTRREASDQEEDSILQQAMDLGADLVQLNTAHDLAEDLIEDPIEEMRDDWPKSTVWRYDENYAQRTADSIMRRISTLTAAGTTSTREFLEDYARRYYRRRVPIAGISFDMMSSRASRITAKVADAFDRINAPPEGSEGSDAVEPLN